MAMSSVGRDALDNCEDDTNASRPPDDPTPMGRSPRNAQSFMFFESGSPTAARATEDADCKKEMSVSYGQSVGGMW